MKTNIDMEKNYDVTAAGRLIWSTSFKSDMSGLEGKELDETIVLVINAGSPVVEVLDANGLNEDEKLYLVTNALAYITRGCNYRYSIKNISGNTYFCN